MGATPTTAGVRFHVWAPNADRVETVFKDGRSFPMERDEDGYFTATIDCGAGDDYKFTIDSRGPFPDPTSRFQPEGPHGWSKVVDAGCFQWSESETTRSGIELPGQILYELHIGAFTPEGTFRAVEREFPRLAEMGISLIELMPVNDFNGEFGWGYDGVSFFAPYHAYGTPDELRHMIDAAHQAGLGVILDVVYNHFGGDGNYLAEFSPYYFSKEATEWGAAPNFDGEKSGPARDFFIENAEYWIRDFHFDGFRFDATQSFNDSGVHGKHILAEIAHAVRSAAGNRKILLFSENESQDSNQLLPSSRDGYGFDAIWNDDFHHSAIVRLTGKREGYYVDHLGSAQEFVSAAKWGFLFQGQYQSWHNAAHGTSFFGVEPWRWVTFLENHDQIANTLLGLRPRFRSSSRRYRAMATYWLLTSGTPMFFMGQEYGAPHPFLFFSDQEAEAGSNLLKGRIESLIKFESIRDTPDLESIMAHPAERATFEACKLNPHDRELPESKAFQGFFRDLIRLRREDPVIRNQYIGYVDGAVLSNDCFVLRYFGDRLHERNDDRLLIVNFGPSLRLGQIPEPLLAAPPKKAWKLKWNSDRIEYGGTSAMTPISATGWQIAEDIAILLAAEDIQSR